MTTLMVAGVLAVALARPGSTHAFEPEPSPSLTATDLDGDPFDMAALAGNVTVLHFTVIEDPVCLECERQMRGQVEQLSALYGLLESPTVVTVNMRSSERSDDGRTLAQRWWGVTPGWTWIEDLPPYTAAEPFREYWSYRGATSNPTVLLIDEDLQVVAVYHVYQTGTGEIDGVQGSAELARRVEDIRAGRWEGGEGEVSAGGATLVGMFALGAITSLTPCSVALLAVVVSYIMSRRGLEATYGALDRRTASAEGLAIGIAFTLGLAIVFFAIGALLGEVGGLVSASTAFYLAAGALLVVLGVNGLWPLSNILRWRDRPDGDGATGQGHRQGLIQGLLARFPRGGAAGAVAGGLALGALFGLAWTPCAISLILPVLVVVMAGGYSWAVAGAMLFVFGLGHGVPVIPLAVVTRSARGGIANRYAAAGRWVVRTFSIVIIALGVIFMLRYFGVALW